MIYHYAAIGILQTHNEIVTCVTLRTNGGRGVRNYEKTNEFRNIQ